MQTDDIGLWDKIPYSDETFRSEILNKLVIKYCWYPYPASKENKILEYYIPEIIRFLNYAQIC